MIISVVGLILFLFLSFRYKRSKLLLFLLLTYACSFLANVLLNMSSNFEISTTAFLYLLTILLVFLLAFKGEIRHPQILVTSKIVTIALFFTVVLIPATLFYGFYAIQTLIYVDLSTSRVDGENLLPANIFNTIFAFFSTLYFVPMLIFYVFYVQHSYRFLRVLLLFSTLSYPLMTLCYSGRDGILYWVMCMLTYYLIFKSSIRKNDVDKIKRYLYIGATIFAVIFMAISLARFSDRDEGTFYYLLSYLGQQTNHFSIAFENDFFQGHGSLFSGWPKMVFWKNITLLVSL